MQMPNKCPSCGSKMLVTRMECSSCTSVVEGKFSLCPVCTMDEGMRRLFDIFMRSRGNLKEAERALGVSYPTARNKMEGLFAYFEESGTHDLSRAEILDMLKSGKLNAAEAADLLKSAGT